MNELEQHKAHVRIAYAKKVKAWDLLISNPYSRANENHYMMKVNNFSHAIASLLRCFDLMKARRQINY